MKDLITDGSDATSTATIKAKQTLLSNGIISYERLVPPTDDSDTNDYILHKITKAERKMTVSSVAGCICFLRGVNLNYIVFF